MPKKHNNDQAEIIGINGSQCESPIITKRKGIDCVDLSFSCKFFDSFSLDFAVRGCGFGDDRWEVPESNQSRYPGYVTYRIKLQRPKTDYENGIVLRSIVSYITMKVYMRDVRAWDAKVTIADLAMPGGESLALRHAISLDTRRLLERKGIGNASQIIRLTREELCMFEGMTTEAIVSIERSLAARLLFLSTAMIEPWTENEETNS